MGQKDLQQPPLLDVKHLTMRFGGLTAIDSLSFCAGRKDITAIIGPNGGGKNHFVQLPHGLLQARRRHDQLSSSR